MNEDIKSEKKTLILALITGMCSSSVLSWLTISEYQLSIFALIALALSVQMLYQNYLRAPMTEDMPLVGFACFLLGVFGYSAVVKAQIPEAGSNFIAIMISLALMVWIGKKLGIIAVDKQTMSYQATAQGES